MGAEEGTRGMTWEDIEEEADKLRVKGGRKGGKAAQIVAQVGALASGAPHDYSGPPTHKAAVDWMIMGAEEGTRDMMWEEIEEGADKLRITGGKEGGASCKTAASKKRKTEGGQAGSDRKKALCAARRQNEHHPRLFFLPECGVFATPEPSTWAWVRDYARIRHC